MFIEKNKYDEIISIFPRACVDILIIDEQQHVLLLLRKNQPEKDKWWFPGGRIHFGESRLEAARRKVKEECGLDVAHLRELATFDLFFETSGTKFHDVTILFKTVVTSQSPVRTDCQSKDYGWFSSQTIKTLSLHPYVSGNLPF